MNSSGLTYQRLIELLSYDQVTGVFTWNVNRKNQFAKKGMVAGHTGREGYVQIFVDRKNYKAHRLAWLYVHGVWPSGVIDHINGIKDCNSITNLRDVTYSVNQQNRRNCTKLNKSGLLGVYKAHNRWGAAIMLEGRTVYLGTFDTKELAHSSYIEAKRKMHIGCSI